MHMGSLTLYFLGPKFIIFSLVLFVCLFVYLCKDYDQVNKKKRHRSHLKKSINLLQYCT